MNTTTTTTRTKAQGIELYYSKALGWVTIPEDDYMTDAEMLAAEKASK